MNIQEEKYVQAIRFAVEILNNYDLSVSKDLTAKLVR
jgi:hypothetical protein|tara:strand:+ start:317 stop:427 length:111 start_codon:yes stop_codon:yes gene_type:complete